MNALTERRYAEAERVFRMALELAETNSTPNKDTVVSMNNVAGVLHYTGKYVEAAAMYERANNLAETVLGADDDIWPNLLTNYGANSRALGRYAQSEALHRRALEIARRITSTEDTIARIENNLGELLFSERRYIEAEQLFLQAKTRSADAWMNLAELYFQTGRFSESESLLREAIRQGLRPAAAWVGLGRLLRRRGKWREAELAFTTSLQHASDPQIRGYALNALGAMFYNRGMYSNAADAFRKAANEQVGRDTAALSLMNLGNALERMHLHEQAASMYQRALIADETALGPGSSHAGA